MQLINIGVHVVVAAGNGSEDAGRSFLACVSEAITVSACTIENRRADFSIMMLQFIFLHLDMTLQAPWPMLAIRYVSLSCPTIQHCNVPF